MKPAPNEDVSKGRPHWGVWWWTLFPFRLVLEIVVTLFDMTLSRYLIAGIVVGIVWAPLHLAMGTSFQYWLWPTLALGLCLTGLWEGCDIFIVRPYLSRWLLIPYEEK